jgi:hypothetical protein
MRLSSLKFQHGIARFVLNTELLDRCNSDGTPVHVDLYVNEASRRAYQVDERNGFYREAELSWGGPSTFGEWKRLEAE